MKLIGSLTSPYVRRIRLLLGDHPHRFQSLDIYAEGRGTLRQSNPALRVPVLEDADLQLYDSRVIARYLLQKFGSPPLDWSQENQLTLVDAVNDSLVILFQGQRSGLDTRSDALLFKLQNERIAAALQALEQEVSEGRFEAWNYPAICLLSLLDWARFRELIQPGRWPALDGWLRARLERADVAETDPRLAG